MYVVSLKTGFRMYMQYWRHIFTCQIAKCLELEPNEIDRKSRIMKIEPIKHFKELKCVTKFRDVQLG